MRQRTLVSVLILTPSESSHCVCHQPTKKRSVIRMKACEEKRQGLELSTELGVLVCLLSLAGGAATSIVFVMTKCVCCDKHMFVMTKHIFCHDKSMLAMTKLLLQQNYVLFVTVNLLSQQNLCCNKNDTCGSSHQ